MSNVSDENEIIDENILYIKFTRNEILYLDDSLTLMIENSPETQHVRPMRPISPVTGGGVPAPVELIQKIGKAVLYTCNVTNQNKEYLMYLDEFDSERIKEFIESYKDRAPQSIPGNYWPQ